MDAAKQTLEVDETGWWEWARFCDAVQPQRDELHRYCRRLTRSLWDAEDLMHDTLLRVFERRGGATAELDQPRAYLFRTATHLWIDVVRRRSRETLVDELEHERAQPSDPVAARDAGRALFEKLAPQERAAVLLKDVFGLSLREVAGVLDTSEGAIKSAIHRGRGRLAESDPAALPARPTPSVETLDRFVAAFNALDVPALTALLLDPIEMGSGFEPTVQALDLVTSERGWLIKTLFGHEPDALATRVSSRDQRIERVDHQGEPLIAVWRVIDGIRAVAELWHLETRGDKISRIRDYCFAPETQALLAADLGLPLHAPRHRAPDQMIAQDLEVERRSPHES